MKTGGPIRGVISRWLVRFEASQQILQAGFLGITAASTLTSALIGLGYERYAPGVLGLGLILTPAFAYGYVESGVYNRKNRERADRGTNFAGPGFAMGQKTSARVLANALAEAMERDPEKVRTAAEAAVDESLTEFRDGIDIDETFHSNGHGQDVVGVDR